MSLHGAMVGLIFAEMFVISNEHLKQISHQDFVKAMLICQLTKKRNLKDDFI